MFNSLDGVCWLKGSSLWEKTCVVSLLAKGDLQPQMACFRFVPRGQLVGESCDRGRVISDVVWPFLDRLVWFKSDWYFAGDRSLQRTARVPFEMQSLSPLTGTHQILTHLLWQHVSLMQKQLFLRNYHPQLVLKSMFNSLISSAFDLGKGFSYFFVFRLPVVCLSQGTRSRAGWRSSGLWKKTSKTAQSKPRRDKGGKLLVGNDGETIARYSML